MIATSPVADPAPDRHGYAAIVIARLHAHLGDQVSPPGPLDLDDDFDPPLTVATDAPTAAILEAILSREPGPAQPQTPPRIDLAHLNVALRFAALFASDAGFQHLLQPGAMTMITEVPTLATEVARQVLADGFLLPPWSLQPDARRSVSGPDVLLCLAPRVSDGEVSKHALRDFVENFTAALGMAHPILLLIPIGAEVPASVTACRPNTLSLPALDQNQLRLILREAVNDWPHKDDDLVRALPSDGQIAALSDEALRSALRLPQRRFVLDRLNHLITTHKRGPNLDDIAGNGAALVAARCMIADLQHWRAGRLQWQDMTRSMLIHGAPGSGKTWLAEAMGNTPGVSFVRASFAGWQACGHLGDLLAAMRSSFAEAIQRRPAVMFVDEIDAVGSRIGNDKHGQNYRANVITGFLQQIDLMMQKQGVLLIGACNFLDRLDPAITRPGRFDQIIEMPQPTAEGLHAILARHFPSGLDARELQALATRAVGCSAADADGAARAAKALARAERRAVTLADIADHLGLTHQDPASDWRVAVHEVGHVITGWMLDVGVIARVALTKTGGETIRPRQTVEITAQGIADELCFTMAGRAAETLILGAASGGAGGPETSDLAHASQLALWLDTRFGLGSLGPLWIAGQDASFMRDPEFRDRVRQRIEAAEERAKRLLNPNRTLMTELAEALLRQREFNQADLSGWKTRLLHEPTEIAL